MSINTNLSAQNSLTQILSYNFFFCFLLSCYCYYSFFVVGKGFTYEPVEGWLNPVNIHDHYVYLNYIDQIKYSSDWLSLAGLNNNFAISLLYYSLHSALSFVGVDISYEALALAVNITIIYLSFRVYFELVRLLQLPIHYGISFFFCTSLIYFAQLINKDSFTILILLLSVKYALQSRWRSFLWILPLSLFIRFQLSALIFVFLFFTTAQKKHVKRFILAYVALSLVNGYLAKYQTLFFNESTLSEGMSYIIYSANINYYIGSLLLNPIRVFQYIYDVLLSFDFISDGMIDVSRLKNVPQVIMLLIFSPFIAHAWLNYSTFMNSREKALISMINAFFGVWLFNPTINARYVILVFPILQLLALSVFNKYKKVESYE